MNIAGAFVGYLEELGKGTFGTDIFIGRLPNEAPTRCYWVKAGGGNPQSKNVSGKRIKEYLIDVYYRNIDGQDVYDQLQSLEETINSSEITELDTKVVFDIAAIGFPTDRDLDVEERTVGMLQVGIQIYQ